MRDGEIESLLAGFGEYLLRSRIVDEMHARYYVGWVRQFLRRPDFMSNVIPDEALTGFLDGLERGGREDWQVERPEGRHRLAGLAAAEPEYRARAEGRSCDRRFRGCRGRHHRASRYDPRPPLFLSF